MTFRWLSQQYSGQPIPETVGLIRNNLYRARWVVTNPIPLVGCAALPTGPIIQSILNMPGTGTAFPADLQVFTTIGGLPADWPADRRDVPGRQVNECVVWAQMRSASDVLLPLGAMIQALAPFNGRLIDFWDQTLDIPLYESLPPGATPPPPVVQPPTTVPTPTPTPPAPTPPPATPRPKKKVSEVVIPWGLGIAAVSLLIRVLRS